LDDHAEDVQAVLMNPPWENSFTKDKQSRKISIDDFKKCFQISTKVMKDGLVFIWVEKELICDLIKCFEAQDFFYVENVCYVMLDQIKKKGIDDSRDIDISDSFVREDY
jgi:tRNA1(Val) A37 N6-methylase TrmN6